MNKLLQRRQERAGATAMMVVVCMGIFIAFFALAIDVGYICLTRAQLQNAADAGALAGAQALYGNSSVLSMNSFPPQTSANITLARTRAQSAVAMNKAGTRKPGTGNELIAELNTSNLASGDIVVGRLESQGDLTEVLTPNILRPNTVQVNVVMKDSHPNGALSLFFGPILGKAANDVEATATASADVPRLMPIAADEAAWNTLASGGIGDDFAFVNGTVINAGGGDDDDDGGLDGIPEIAVFPGEWTIGASPPGHFALLNLGPTQGAARIRQQLAFGVSSSDIVFEGGTLDTGDVFSGSTQMSTEIAPALSGGTADGINYPGMIGETRYMLLYNSAHQGTSTTFTISQIVLVRVMDANLHGSPQVVVLQPVTNAKDIGFGLAR